MKHTQIHNYIESAYTRIDLLYDNVAMHFNAEDIHLFRLEVKKLRAFLRLAEAATDDGAELKLPKILNEFYDATGVIRSLQIQEQHVQKISGDGHSAGPEEYLNLLAVKIANNIKLAKEFAKTKTPFKKGEKKLLGIFPEKLKRAMIRKFTRSRINMLSKLLKPIVLIDESLNATRKLLKDLLYTWPYRKQTLVLKPSEIFTGDNNIVFIIRLLDDFQDLCVCLELLHAEYIDKELTETDGILLKDIEKKWLIDKETRREELYKTLQKEIFLQQRYTVFPVNARLKPKGKILSTEVIDL